MESRASESRVFRIDQVGPCQHYRCTAQDVAPIAYEVLGAVFIRWLCRTHAPALAPDVALNERAA